MMRHVASGRDGVPEERVAQVAIDFIAFCFERKGAEWPVLYDEMCYVAGKRLYRGLGYDRKPRRPWASWFPAAARGE